MNYTAHILSHTHWDREWYLNSKYTNEWLIPFFDNLFAMCEKEENYKFILDGQLSMIDDYFEELNKAGRSVAEGQRTFRKYVGRGNLFIGPYYLQPDWQLISEESLVRNLTIGRKLADSLGGCIKSGWLLDNFGQISQTAQIHKLAGITGLFAWRGVAMDPEKVTSEFLWEAPDGTKLLSVYLLNSYRNVMRLAEYDRIMKERMDVEVEKLKPFATTSNLLMMNGYDQEMIPDDIQPYIRSGQLNGKDYKTVQNDPDSYLQAIAAEKPDLPVLKGALYNGRFISVFPGVMSARIYLKIQNDQNQKLLEKKAEPLSLLSWMNGGEYGETILEQAWKLLLKNHPHDSICGVSIDNVHKDMEERNRQVYALGSSLFKDRIDWLASRIDSSSLSGEEGLIVFNTLPRTRDCLVHSKGETRFIKNVPAMGYKVSDGKDLPCEALNSTERTAENRLIAFKLNEDGSFNLTYKATGRTYENLGILEDSGDSGDEYNYSYPDEDRFYTSKGLPAEISLISQNDYEAVYRVSRVMELPESDVNNHKERSQTLRSLPIVSYITVEADSPVVKIRTTLKNTVKDHRMRVLMPSGFDSSTAYAASPFDITERPVHIEPYGEESIPEHVKKVIVGAREANPSTYFHTREFLDLNDGKEGLALFNKGLPEYQVTEGGTMALTLFRSIGWIAKEINTRIGDAGPEIYTPDAQCLREMTFEYALCPHEGTAYSGDVLYKSEEYNNEAIGVNVKAAPGKLPAYSGLFSYDDRERCSKITAVKRSEDGSAMIIRGVNLSPKENRFTFRFEVNALSYGLVNFLEEETVPLESSDNEVSFTARGKEIFTLKAVVSKMRDERKAPNMPVLEDGLPREDFSQFDYAEYVSDGDIENEKARAEKLKEKIEDPLWRRSALEAQLSHILTRHRQDEKKIRALGYQLNEARVQRRIHDYLSANLSLEEE
ncbi:MAG: glycoside hydrolase family 38 C-terminal domain-containing protein [Spirochaetales bacterium]|nr:glycoside hydrolase family 38 C-terminal domain-containing protein [Spirochaetales bacterium]